MPLKSALFPSPRKTAGALRWLLLAFAVALALSASGAPARAQIVCTTSVSPLAFPTNMDVLPGAPFDSASSISASCTGLTGGWRVSYCFFMTGGTYPPAGGWEQMGSGANRLRFNLYTDAARTISWNSANPIRLTLTAAAPSGSTPYYGRVAGAQPTAVPGAYTSNMNVTISSIQSNGAPSGCPGASGSASFLVSGTVVSSCNATATNMLFANTAALSSNLDATSSVGVTCTNTTPYHIRLNGGTSGATNPTLRKMFLGANTITYGLYRDAGRTLSWGSTDGVDTVAGTGTASPNSHTVYGRIPPQPTPPAGTYTDTIVVTVSFL